MNTLGELSARKLFLLDGFDDELFIHYLINFVMLHLRIYYPKLLLYQEIFMLIKLLTDLNILVLRYYIIVI